MECIEEEEEEVSSLEFKRGSFVDSDLWLEEKQMNENGGGENDVGSEEGKN